MFLFTIQNSGFAIRLREVVRRNSLLCMGSTAEFHNECGEA